MNLSVQEITAELFDLPEQEQQEVADFIAFLKTKLAQQKVKRFVVNQKKQPVQQAEGERILAILENSGLLGCMENADENLSENYKAHLWGSE